jgi:2-polyprenyl-6-methoxyphenol hydroxylase-like FAD-dependent oxidoreductase
MQAVTDGLWRLFGAGDPFLRLVRNRGMGLLNEFAAAKALLMQPAMR